MKVPDPEVVAQLSISEEKNDKLQKENANLQIKIDSLQKDISEAKESISDLEAKVCIPLYLLCFCLSFDSP